MARVAEVLLASMPQPSARVLTSASENIMQEATPDSLQIAYIGPALSGGRMPMEALATGLRGQALLIHRVKDLLYGDAVSIRVEVDTDFLPGSLIVPVHILVEGLHTAEHLLASEGTTALVNLLALLGFVRGVGVSLYKLFRRRKGLRIESVNDLPIRDSVDVPTELLIRIYNDAEVQAQLRQAIEPLRLSGVDEFQTRRAGQAVDFILKADLRAADEAEVDDLTQDEEVVLDIEKVAWRRSLAWHFRDGESSFDAKIEDDKFWRGIGREAFSDGDRMRVHLRTTARRTPQGTLKIQRVIPEVFSVDHAKQRQGDLFGSDVREQPSRGLRADSEQNARAALTGNKRLFRADEE